MRRPRALTADTLFLVTLSAAAIAACAKVGEDVFSKETAPFDEPIRAWMLARQSPAGRRFFLVITNVGSPTVIIPITAGIAMWLRGRYGLEIAGAVVLAPAVSLALFVAVKQLYRRKRPTGGETLHERTYAFPSGHAAASAAIFGTLAYVLRREGLLSRRAAATLGTLPTLLIGSSRVYLDVHWPTDVLGGWSLGALVTAFSAGVYERVRADTRRHGTPAPAPARGPLSTSTSKRP